MVRFTVCRALWSLLCVLLIAGSAHAAVPTVTLTAPDATATEGGSGTDTGTFRFTRTAPYDSALTVNFGRSGTATPNLDFTLFPGSSVTIPAGAAYADATVYPLDDSNSEQPETVVVTISSNAAYTIGSPSTATVTIYDDEPTNVRVLATDANASEQGTDTGTFQFDRFGVGSNGQSDLTVTYTISGTATPGSDYTALPGTITIPAGSLAATVMVTPIDDSISEPDETVIVTVQAGPGYVPNSLSSATITIADNDAQVVSLAVTDATASEPGSDTGTFTVSRTGTKTSALTVNYTVGGTATNGTDYTTLSGSVAIPAGSASATITVTPIDDSSPEGDETVIVTLGTGTGYSLGTAITGTVTIADNEPVYSIVATDPTAFEPGTDTGTFTVSRKLATSSAVTLSYTVSGTATSGSDYTALSGSVTIPANQTSATITVTPIDDSSVESAESVIVTLASNSSYFLAAPSATVWIGDNDSTLSTVTCSCSDTIRENGTATGTITVTRTTPTTSDLVVYYTAGGIASTPGVDYVAFPGSVTIPAGQTSATITVTPIDDSIAEPTESAGINLTAWATYKLGAPTQIAAQCFILDDDFPVTSLSGGDTHAGEPGSDTGRVAIKRDGSLDNDLVVYLSYSGTATPGVDYETLPGSVTIPAGSASTNIYITPIDDSISENTETVIVTLVPNVNYGINQFANSIVYIWDNDPQVVFVTVTDAQCGEPSDQGQFTINRWGDATNALTVTYSMSGTATNGTDYTSLSGSVTVPAASNTATVNVVPINDTLQEGDETVTLTINSSVNYGIADPASATITLTDDEQGVWVTATDPSAYESTGKPAFFTITRSGSVAAALTVNYTLSGTATSGTDYLAQTGSVQILINGRNAAVPIVPLNDSSYEGTETVILTITSSSNYVVLGSPATVNIYDSQNDPPSFTKGSNQTVLEDAGAQTVSGWATQISAGPADEASQTVTFLVTNDNNALFSVQPVVSSAGTLTFTPAANANGVATVSVQAHDDGGTANGGIDTSATQTFTITVTAVNDAPAFTKGANQTVLEDAGAQSVANWATSISAGPADESGQVLSFTLSNDNNALFSVQPAVGTTGTLIYTPAANANGSATVTISLHDDGGTANSGADTSASQTFTITVTAVNDAPTLASIADPAAILEDAGQQTINLTGISAGPANESGQVLTVTATSSNTAVIPNPTVSYTSANATGSLAYTPVANANGSAVITVTVQDEGGTANNGADTVSQTFTVSVTAVNDAPSFTKGSDQTVLEDAGAQSVANWATGISAGPANEAGQVLSFAVSNDNNALFSVQPGVGTTGNLTFTPAANANGSATVTISLHDDGGTANGGADTSAAQTFTITVTAVNDAPTLASISDPAAILEDAGQQTVNLSGIGAGPANENGQGLTVTATSSNTAVIPNPTVNYTSANATGSLAYTPVANANGSAVITVTVQDDGGTANDGIDTVSRAFTVSVTAVNDAPSFTKGADQTTAADAGAQTVSGWATAISPGPANEGGQALNFLVSADHTELFSVQPAVSASGALSFTPAAAGTATVTVRLHDDGGTANGGVDTSAAQTFTITVSPAQSANQAPSFTKGANQTVLEDAGARTVTAWATNISPGPAAESSQQVSFFVSVDNAALFSAAPAIAANGTLTYTPAANANGSATVTVRAHDDGGTANGGVDTSAPQTFTITVTPVNDAPTFVMGGAVLAAQGSGQQWVPNWIQRINAGADNETDQALTFTVSVDDSSLFSVQPTVAPYGTLIFTPASSVSGTATVTVTLHDDGGTSNGGSDTSASSTATITISAQTSTPQFALDSPRVVTEDCGAKSFPHWATAVPMSSDPGGSGIVYEVLVNDPSLFSVQPAIDGSGTLTFTPATNAFGTAQLTVLMFDSSTTGGGGGFGGGGFGGGGPGGGGPVSGGQQSSTISILPVDDAPSFTAGVDPVAVIGSSQQTYASWATGISKGPSNESAQTLHFVVAVDRPELFVVAPAISSNGTLTFTPGTTVGLATATVTLIDDGGTADDGVDTATRIVPFALVANAVGPSIVVPARVGADPVQTTSTPISVLGGFVGGESLLTYTWSTVGTLPGDVFFSDNGTNAAKSTSVRFTTPGTYTFRATVAAPGGASATSDVTVVVAAQPTRVAISPDSVHLVIGRPLQFTAALRDQFDGIIVGVDQPVWSSSGGTVASDGTFTGSAIGDAQLTAVIGDLAASAKVVVTPIPAPEFTPDAGTYIDSASIALSAPNGLAIYYTIASDGSTPADPVPGPGATLFSAPIAITHSSIIKAVAALPGNTAITGPVASASFDIVSQADITTTSPNANGYSPDQTGGVLVSPACVEESVPSNGLAFAATVDGGIARSRVLGEGHVLVEAPLNPFAPASIVVAATDHRGTALPNPVQRTWIPLDLSAGTTPNIDIRIGDSLLFTATSADGGLTLDLGDGRTFAVSSGARVPVRFDNRGQFDVTATSLGGESLGTCTVRVIGSPFTSAMIACEVDYQRSVDLSQVLDADRLVFASADARYLIVSGGSGYQSASLTIKPLKRGTPMIAARLGGAGGPVVGLKEVDEFQIERCIATRGTVLDVVDNRGETDSLIRVRPYLPDLILTLKAENIDQSGTHEIFGGATSTQQVTSQDVTLSDDPNAQPMRVDYDPETKEMVGWYRYPTAITYQTTAWHGVFTAYQVPAGASTPRVQVASNASVDALIRKMGMTLVQPTSYPSPSGGVSHYDPVATQLSITLTPFDAAVFKELAVRAPAGSRTFPVSPDNVRMPSPMLTASGDPLLSITDSINDDGRPPTFVYSAIGFDRISGAQLGTASANPVNFEPPQLAGGMMTSITGTGLAHRWVDVAEYNAGVNAYYYISGYNGNFPNASFDTYTKQPSTVVTVELKDKVASVPLSSYQETPSLPNANQLEPEGAGPMPVDPNPLQYFVPGLFSPGFVGVDGSVSADYFTAILYGDPSVHIQFGPRRLYVKVPGTDSWVVPTKSDQMVTVDGANFVVAAASTSGSIPLTWDTTLIDVLNSAASPPASVSSPYSQTLAERTMGGWQTYTFVVTSSGPGGPVIQQQKTNEEPPKPSGIFTGGSSFTLGPKSKDGVLVLTSQTGRTTQVLHLAPGLGAPQPSMATTEAIPGYATVDIGRGNLYFATPIARYDTPVAGPDCVLSYNSQDCIKTALGRGWRTTYDARVYDAYDSTTVDHVGTRLWLVDETGQRVRFGRNETRTDIPTYVAENGTLSATIVRRKDTTRAGEGWRIGERYRLSRHDNRWLFFDELGHLHRITDLRGDTILVELDRDGNPTRAYNEKDLRSVDLTRPRFGTQGPFGDLVTLDYGLSGSWTFGYDGRGNLTSATANGRADSQFTGGGTVTYTIGYQDQALGRDRVASVTPPAVGAGALVTTISALDATAKHVTVTHALGGTTEFDLDRSTDLSIWVMKKVVGRDHVETDYTYSSTAIRDGQEVLRHLSDFGLAQTIKVGTRVETREYDSSGNVVSSTLTGTNVSPLVTKAVFRQLPPGDPDVLFWPSETMVLSSRTVAGVAGVEGERDAIDLTTVFSYRTKQPGIGQVQSMTDPCGALTRYAYGADNLVSTTTDPRGQVTTVASRTQFGSPLDVQLPSGKHLHDTWASDGFHLSTTDVMGYTTTFTADSFRRVKKTQGPGPASVTTTYDPFGQVRTIDRDPTDGPHQIATTDYDALGRPVSEQQPGQTAVTTTYAKAGDQWTITSMGQKSYHQSVIDAAGRTLQDSVKRTLSPEAQPDVTTTCTTSYQYNDPNGWLTDITDPESNLTHLHHDGLGRVDQTTAANGGIETTTYNTLGWVLSTTDADNHTTTTSYDPCGRAFASVNPAGGIAQSLYDWSGNLVAARSSADRGESYGYDQDGVQTSRTDVFGQDHGTTIDAQHQSIITTGPGGQTMTRSLDAEGRQQQVDVTASNISQPLRTLYSYPDHHGSSTTTPPGRLAQVVVGDAVGRPYHRYVQGQVGANATAQIFTDTTFDPDLGTPTGSTGFFGQQSAQAPAAQTGEVNASSDNHNADDASALSASFTVVERDKRGLVKTYLDAANRQHHATYDAIGRKRTETAPDGVITTWTYSGNGSGNLLVSVATAGANNGSTTTSYTHDRLGNVTSVTNDLGETATRRYDAMGRLVQETAQGVATVYAYDGSTGAVSDVLRPGGRATHFTRDGRGRLMDVADADGQHLGYHYDDLDRVTLTDLPDGRHEGRAYHPTSGDLATLTESGTSSDGTAGTRSVSFARDGAGRLTDATYDDGTVVHHDLDVWTGTNGTRGQVQATTLTTASGSTTTTRRLDRGSQLRSLELPGQGAVGMTYNNAGQLLTRGGDTFAYDATTGRITSVTSGGITVTPQYDDLGRLSDLLLPDPEDQSHTSPVAQIHYTHDAVGRLIGLSRAMPFGTETFTSTYDSLGRMQSMATVHTTAQTERVDYGYDSLSQLAVEHVTGMERGIRQYAYDRRGNRHALRVAAGTIHDATHADVALSPGDAAQAWDTGSETVLRIAAHAVTAPTTNGGNQSPLLVASLTLGDGEGTTPGHYAVEVKAQAHGSATQRWLEIRWIPSVGSELLLAQSDLDGDSAGDLVVDLMPQGIRAELSSSTGHPLVADAPTEVQVHGDVGFAVAGTSASGATLSAIAAETAPESAITLTQSSYLVGDRLASEVTSSQNVTTGTAAYTIDAFGRLVQVVRTGANAGTTTYGFDRLDRMVSLSQPGVASTYSYVGDSWMRSSATENGVTTTFAWDGRNVTSSTVGGVTTTYAYLGNQPLWFQRNGGLPTYYGHDILGNVVGRIGRATLEANPTWQYVSRYRYDAWGNVRQWNRTAGTTDPLWGSGYQAVAVGTEYGSGTVAGGLGYKGEWRDASGLTYLRHRFYDPALGRFDQSDPAKAGHNYWIFASDDPVNRADPMGLDDIKVSTNGKITWVPDDGSSPFDIGTTSPTFAGSDDASSYPGSSIAPNGYLVVPGETAAIAGNLGGGTVNYQQLYALAKISHLHLDANNESASISAIGETTNYLVREEVLKNIRDKFSTFFTPIIQGTTVANGVQTTIHQNAIDSAVDLEDKYSFNGKAPEVVKTTLNSSIHSAISKASDDFVASAWKAEIWGAVYDALAAKAALAEARGSGRPTVPRTGGIVNIRPNIGGPPNRGSIPDFEKFPESQIYSGIYEVPTGLLRIEPSAGRVNEPAVGFVGRNGGHTVIANNMEGAVAGAPAIEGKAAFTLFPNGSGGFRVGWRSLGVNGNNFQSLEPPKEIKQLIVDALRQQTNKVITPDP